VGLAGWAAALAVRPELMGIEHGGWMAPLVLLVAGRRLAVVIAAASTMAVLEPLPPTREVRGTVSLRRVVAGGPDGLPRTVPIDLELRAGSSLAVLCDTATDRGLLAEVLCGRRPPLAGELSVDGVPLDRRDRLVAVVAPGERFVPGSIEGTLGSLCEAEPDRATVVAVTEACGLDEVREALGDGVLAVDGAPLEPFHRLLLLAGRVIPSHYRVVVVVDPMPWVNPVRGERWRSAVVRASVGRTAFWLTADRDLAARADHVVEFRQGALRPPGCRDDGAAGPD
jgi:ABC-type transport system involved in cytochrome bd biosynthesis fused ATPase/permease subunit